MPENHTYTTLPTEEQVENPLENLGVDVEEETELKLDINVNVETKLPAHNLENEYDFEYEEPDGCLKCLLMLDYYLPCFRCLWESCYVTLAKYSR